MSIDVICGMEVDEEQAAAKGLTSEYQGRMYYFCSPGCKRDFEQNPEHYADRTPPPSE